jgi:hypothetical protein
MTAGHEVDHGAADALCAGIALSLSLVVPKKARRSCGSRRGVAAAAEGKERWRSRARSLFPLCHSCSLSHKTGNQRHLSLRTRNAPPEGPSVIEAPITEAAGARASLNHPRA